MAKTSTRVLEMQRNFIRLRNEGKSIAEIANAFNLSTCTVYLRLQEIADENGVSRKDLLQNDYPETRASVASKTKKSEKDEIDVRVFCRDTLSTMNVKISSFEKFNK